MRTWLRTIMRHFTISADAACADASKGYEEAVRALNTLQSNAKTLEISKKEKDKNKHLNFPAIIKFLERTGVNVDELDKLNIIHVSGTKGKGSTCAFCEKILRSHGYRTGFYSSPHLIEVRERIRINGKPLSKEAFSSYFWQCYNKLESTKEEHDGAMPAYFRFLTIMAFQVFIQEKVDVAVMEVGIGGEYDCTNVIRHPVVCGVTSLGLDHTSLLGETIDKIAWHKAGIFKTGVPAVTVAQDADAMTVLRQRATEKQCQLTVAPSLGDYDWSEKPVELGIAGHKQHMNASLALQLCRVWMDTYHKGINERLSVQSQTTDQELIAAETFTVSEEMANGLKDTQWAGRNQIINKERLTYYIDGAHTPESMQQCAVWFKKVAEEEKAKIGHKVVRVLVFNMTGDRLPGSLMLPLLNSDFDCAVFCPNIVTKSSNCADQTNLMVTTDSQHNKCIVNRNAWLEVVSNQFNLPPQEGSSGGIASHKRSSSEFISDENDSNKRPKLQDKKMTEASSSSQTEVTMPTYTFGSISEALQWCSQGHENSISLDSTVLPTVPESLENPAHIQVLVTGSLHLVGGVLRLIHPSMND